MELPTSPHSSVSLVALFLSSAFLLFFSSAFFFVGTTDDELVSCTLPLWSREKERRVGKRKTTDASIQIDVLVALSFNGLVLKLLERPASLGLGEGEGADLGGEGEEVVVAGGKREKEGRKGQTRPRSRACAPNSPDPSAHYPPAHLPYPHLHPDVVPLPA